jgi:aryl-alcohol dehydrogenase-like predicted oxidoreductase
MNLMTGKLTRKALDIADVVKEIAKELGRTPAQVAVAWTLLNPAVASSIIGVRTLAQLQDNLASLEFDFTLGQIERLDGVSRVEPVFPYDILQGSSKTFMFGGVKVAERRP